MPDGSSLPGWPLLMDETMAARFTGYTRRDFSALVKAQVFPPPRAFAPVEIPRWHRFELEAVTGRLYGLDALAPTQQDEAARKAAMEALDDFTPPPLRRQASPRPGNPKG
jgi:hypothetical protein